MGALLILAVLATAFCGFMWKVAVVRGASEGEGASLARAISSGFWISALMIVSFLTLELFARDLAVWCGYATKAF